MSYYNTTHESGENLTEYWEKANAQQRLVLDFFSERKGMLFTPSQVYKALHIPETPLTSIRRAITDLTNEGLLHKTDSKRMGDYGRPECCWKMPIPDDKRSWDDVIEQAMRRR